MKKAIYKITNLINHKVYIGQSIHPQKRWWEHCQRAKTDSDKLPIHLAIKKYGEENFLFEILEWTENYNERETELIKKYNSISPNGYNLLVENINPVYYGEEHPRNTISQINVEKVISLLKEGQLTYQSIAKIVNSTEKIVSDINKGITHVVDGLEYPIRKNFQRKDRLTPSQVQEIKKLLKETRISYEIIAKQFNVTKGTIYHINKGKTYKENICYPIRKENVNVEQ